MSDEKKEIAIRGQGLELATFSDLQRFAACVVDSFKVGKPCVPSCYNTLPQAVMAIQAGGEVGFPPMQSLNALYPIDGKLSLYTEAAMAIALNSGEVKGLKTFWRWTEKGKEQESDEAPVSMNLEQMEAANLTCIIELKTTISTQKHLYSVADAKLANLWKRTSGDGKKVPSWWGHPKDMLYNRCLSRALHKQLPHRLRGLKIEGDMESVEPQEHAHEHAPAKYTNYTKTAPYVEIFDGTPVIIGAPQSTPPPPPVAPKPKPEPKQEAEIAHDIVETAPEKEALEAAHLSFTIADFAEQADEQLPEGLDAEFLEGLFEEEEPNPLAETQSKIMAICEAFAKQLGGGAISAEKALERLLKRAGLKDINTPDRANRMLDVAVKYAAEKGVKI